jgi:hypothetical protein
MVTMSMPSRLEYLKNLKKRYLKATKIENKIPEAETFFSLDP